MMTVATILSPIIGIIAIIVSLYIARKNSKDIMKMVKSNRIDSDNQIRVIRDSSLNEIKQTRNLSHILLLAVLHNLQKENHEIVEEKQYLRKELVPILEKIEKNKDWKIDEDEEINVDEINAHFAEVKEIEDTLINAINKSQNLQDLANLVSQTLQGLQKPIDEYNEVI